ncbi:hypothetical protein ASPFODRAFT_65529 [Aspergillus luchuensis CBS 106.47]|uniref:Lariat debranching enzyme C-terminal domain-containing protein n=1 Tax=Aspergillus luchuensis (strain CBS 106.47) TaxID=1137211 RepID=A0A1M3T2Q8_ASPLC|nr:hypothetical protein ASPFODRAFT_65529 [Aspergillus luchuensis CBS 106.47]
MEVQTSDSASLRVAFEGCGHGCLHDIYASVDKAASLKGWDGVDLLIIGGDFQAVRNANDLACMSVPMKYRELGDFHEYYSGQRVAPYLTIFVGGNHEASNHLFELYYGGWVAPNIYYLGAANVIRCGPLRIAGMSGIWKGYDYRRPHFERLPYNSDDVQSIYHVRELDVRKLLQIRTQVDLGLSHDWPKTVERSGDFETLFNKKIGFREDSQNGRLGSMAAKHVLDRLRPAYWFSAHLHVKFAARVQHAEYVVPEHPAAKRQAASGATDASQRPSAPFALDGAVFTSLVLGEENQNPLNEPVASASTANSDKQSQSNAVRTGASQLQSESGQPAHQPSKTDVSAGEAASSMETKLSAWNNFHVVAARNEAAENELYLSGKAQNPGPNPYELKHNLTWKRVETDMDGVNRKIASVERDVSPEQQNPKKQKVDHGSDVVKNSDEIDLDLDSDSDDASSKAQPETVVSGNSGSPAMTSTPTQLERNNITSQAEPAKATDVSQDVRNQLPASFSRPQPDPYPVNGPLPEAIANNVTNFLALDKCLPNREFLQLLEINSISGSDGAKVERPYRLEYDKEWLAITRAFANDLHLGDPNARPSADKGDVVYLPQILEEEKWVEENVVKPGKLVVPENFTQTAPIYDPSVPLTTEEMPIEYTNPQTAEFCELIGIENKFDMSDAERQARMARGPRPSSNRGGMGRGPRRGGFGFGRGRGRGGRGRGNRY